MLSALSDSYLPLMDHNLDFSMDDGGGGGGKRILSPEENLMPPLSMQDRHPSAPQLASMLTSSVDNHKMSDVTVSVDEEVSQPF